MPEETPIWLIWLAIDFAEKAESPERVPEFIDILRSLGITGDTPVAEVERRFQAALSERSAE